ncbi:hypothetical protein BDY19DRAFT_994747 [Irpex rosettiformis]|uniref:Uncharacterized protein n=1 Tax=Irpex rosettiformis TaxID=378272 RepID=A0ACB8U0V4_9APHY|nr:hypothetical protein BDY19DRAFT_994747 [Irpex rosettiformis]
MFHDVTIPAAAILEAWFSALLYGVLLVADIFYFRLAVFQGFKNRVHRIMCGLVAIQLLLSTAVTALCLQQLLYGLRAAPDTILYFSNQGRPANVGQTAAGILNYWIADSVLVGLLATAALPHSPIANKVWRLYIVFNKNKFILIPYGFLITASFAAGSGLLHAMANGNDLSKLFGAVIAAWSNTYWGLTITIQISASCLIAFKIWVVQNRVTTTRAGSSWSISIVWIILESGAVLSLITALLLAFYTLHTIAGGVVGAISAQLAALIPVTILLRVTLKRISIHCTDSIPSSVLVDVRRDVENTGNSSSDSTMIHVQRSIIVQEECELYDLGKSMARKS